MLKILSLLTSYLSLTMGINKYVVCRESILSSQDWRMIVKNYFYTFCDLHLRLGFYLLNCILMQLRYLIIYALQSVICFITCIILKKDNKKVLSFFYIFSANILPQCVMDKSMRVMMTLKTVYNIIYAILLCYYAALIYTFDNNENLFEKLNLFHLSLGRISSSAMKQPGHSYGVCHLYENTTRLDVEENPFDKIQQLPTQISKELILDVQIPIIAILLFISSFEIIIFGFCNKTWKQFIYGREDKVTLQVALFFK